jgi:hypothetical protein
LRWGVFTMRLEYIICDAPGLPLSSDSPANHHGTGMSPWQGSEQSTALRMTRGGAIVAPKQLSVEGTRVRTARNLTVDFPYIHVRAGAQDLA